jgi:hypothetical protein
MTARALDPGRSALVRAAMESPDRDVILRAALDANRILGVPMERHLTQPAHVEKLRQLAAYLEEWADVADRAIAAR